MDAETGGSLAPANGAHRCDQRPAEQWPADIPGHRSRRRGTPGHRGVRHHRCALRRFRPAADLHHLHPGQPVPRGARSGGGRSPRAAGAGTDLRAERGRHAGAAVEPGAPGTALGAAADQPHRPVPRGHAVVQPRRGRVVGRGRRGDRGCRSADRPAGRHPESLPGRRRGVSRFAVEHAAADSRRRGDHVHRARRALRELYPPDHHPLDTAFGGGRRLARLAADR